MTSRALLIALIASAGCAVPPKPDIDSLKRQVADTERAFARTMAERDHKAFTSFLSHETVFFAGPKPIRGAKEVAESWKRFYAAPEAPFSWEPEQVEVLDSGTLAIATGPVRDPKGRVFATFNSIWRLEPDGKWRVIFDKGSPVCPPPKP
jgi:ketosteroid isomerase-like protein